MKRTTSILALIFFASTMVFTSCKKDYTCECVSTTGSSSSSESFTITDTKNDAAAECNEKDASTTILRINTVKECELK